MATLSEGVYWIRSRYSGKVLDLSGDSSEDGARVIDFAQRAPAINTTHNQLWLVELTPSRKSYTIRNADTGTIIDLSGGNANDDTPIIGWTDHGTSNQMWRIEWVTDYDRKAYYRIVNEKSNTALDQGEGHGGAIGWTSHSGLKQQWEFESLPEPVLCRFRNSATKNFLDLLKGSSADSTPVVALKEHPITESRNQVWHVESTSDGDSFVFRNLEASTVLTVGSESETSAIGSEFRKAKNQLWTFIDDGDRFGDGTFYYQISNVAAGTFLNNSFGDLPQLVEGLSANYGENQKWIMETVPSPTLFWITIQNAASGRLLQSISGASNVSSVLRPIGSVDYSIHWRLVEHDRTGIYGLVNRETRQFLSNVDSAVGGMSIEMSSSMNGDSENWMLAAAQGFTAIVNRRTGHTLDHYAGKSIQAYESGFESPYRQWSIAPTYDNVPSFALINGETGYSLSSVYRREESRISLAQTIEDFQTQWTFTKVGFDASGPKYSIVNKGSGHKLQGSTGGYEWRLIVCGEKYFGLCNVDTGYYLGVVGSNITFGDHDMTDRSQCWELVSSREGDYDMVFLDDDIIEALAPHLTKQESTDLEHHIEKRSPKKPPKGQDNWSLPRSDRVTELAQNSPIRTILEALIELWEWDSIAPNHRQGTLVSFNASEATAAFNGPLPRNIRDAYNSSRAATVFRIDVQAPFNIGNTPYVNIQGQFGTNTYFHINFPAGVNYGAEQIRAWLRESLKNSTSVVVTPTTCKPPSGGPTFKRDPGSGGGNSWIKWLVTIILIGGTSVVMM